MGWADAEDRLNKSVRNRYGESGTLTPATGTPYPVSAVPSHDVEMFDEGSNIILKTTTLAFRKADLVAKLVPGDSFTVTVGSRRYYIQALFSDDGNWVTYTAS